MLLSLALGQADKSFAGGLTEYTLATNSACIVTSSLLIVHGVVMIKDN